LGSVLDWIVANGVVINAVLSSSIVLALLGFLIRILQRGWKGVHGRGRAVLIRSSHSRLVGWIEQIQERVFPADECDPRGVLGARIDRSKFDWFGRPRSDEAVIAIVYIKGRTPVAYLSAEYFRQNGGIFFWYIVSLRDKKFKDELAHLDIDWDEIASAKGINIPAELVEKLLDVCGGEKWPWKYIVAEVDVDDLEVASLKVGDFQRVAGEVYRRWQENLLKRDNLPHPEAKAHDPQVFKVDVPFAMPLHDADLVHEAEAHESPGWLLFAPRTPKTYETGKNEYEIDGAEVRDDLLKTLRLGYHNGDADYDAYLAKFYERLASAVPERVKLIHNRAVMLPPRRATVEVSRRGGASAHSVSAPRRRASRAADTGSQGAGSPPSRQ